MTTEARSINPAELMGPLSPSELAEVAANDTRADALRLLSEHTEHWLDDLDVTARSRISEPVGKLDSIDEIAAEVSGTILEGPSSASWELRQDSEDHFGRQLRYSFRSGQLEVFSNNEGLFAPGQPYKDTVHRSVKAVLVNEARSWKIRPIKPNSDGYNNDVATWNRNLGITGITHPSINGRLRLTMSQRGVYYLEEHDEYGLKKIFDSIVSHLDSRFWKGDEGKRIVALYGVDQELLEGFDDSRLGDLVRHVWEAATPPHHSP